MENYDPWGEALPKMTPFISCSYVGPNRLPCTSNANDHPGRHFTSDGRSWSMTEPLVFEGDDEKFCRRCLAGVDSSEHAEKCYYFGHAEMGESA